MNLALELSSKRHWSGDWTPFIGSGDANRTKHDNRTIDVTRKNCVTDYDTVACVRSTFLSVICGLTAIICISRLIRFHSTTSSQCYHRLILFYVLVIHSLIGMIELCVGWTTQAALASTYLRSLELLIICHFYLTLTTRVLHCSTEVSTRLSVFALSLLYVYFTAFVVIGLVYALTPWLDCFAPYWLWLSGGNMFTTQLMVLTSLILVHKINLVSAQSSLKRTQKRHLIWLILAFEVSVFFDLAYHVYMFTMATDRTGCSGVFHHRQTIYSGVKVVVEVFTYLLPIWVILWVFRRSPNDQEPTSHCYTTMSSSISVMLDPSLMPATNVSNWRRPLNQRLMLPTSSVPYRRIRSRSGRRGRYIRRTHSAPTLTNRNSRTKRNCIISKTLDTIPEEEYSYETSPSSSLLSNELVVDIEPTSDSSSVAV